MPDHPAALLPPFDDDGALTVVVETVRGSRAKIAYDARHGVFRLKHLLPEGAVFPHDFGFVPGTRAGDGDPLDVLLLADDATFAGCVVAARLVGVLEAEQRDEGDAGGDAGGDAERNDRLIAVAAASHAHATVRALDDLGEPVLAQLEHFFVSYNAARGKRFTPLGRGDAARARAIADAARVDP